MFCPARPHEPPAVSVTAAGRRPSTYPARLGKAIAVTASGEATFGCHNPPSPPYPAPGSRSPSLQATASAAHAAVDVVACTGATKAVTRRTAAGPFTAGLVTVTRVSNVGRSRSAPWTAPRPRTWTTDVTTPRATTAAA